MAMKMMMRYVSSYFFITFYIYFVLVIMRASLVKMGDSLHKIAEETVNGHGTTK